MTALSLDYSEPVRVTAFDAMKTGDAHLLLKRMN